MMSFELVRSFNFKSISKQFIALLVNLFSSHQPLHPSGTTPHIARAGLRRSFDSSAMFRAATRTVLRPSLLTSPNAHLRLRTLSTLSSNKHIYILPSSTRPGTHILTFLPTNPPTESLAIATTTANPPTPSSVASNPQFLTLLHKTLATHAHKDPELISQAAALASSSGGTTLQQTARRQQTGSAGASDQGGAGGGGVGGWIHVYDHRRIPDWGRIPDPEDIFGSLEVDADGTFTDGTGRYQESGTYRVCTNDGVVVLSEYLRGRVVEVLRAEEGKIKK